MQVAISAWRSFNSRAFLSYSSCVIRGRPRPQAGDCDPRQANLPGGLPIIVDGHVVGGIGVGLGTGEQDREVANAALAAIPGARRFD
jgi:hypothetical protein